MLLMAVNVVWGALAADLEAEAEAEAQAQATKAWCRGAKAVLDDQTAGFFC